MRIFFTCVRFLYRCKTRLVPQLPAAAFASIKESRRWKSGPLALTARCIEITEASMSTRRAKPNAIGRALLAGFALGLLVLQGLTFRHAHEFDPNRFVENVINSTPDASGELCIGSARDDGPGRRRGDNANHCVCCATARDGSLVPLLKTASQELPFVLGPSFLILELADQRNLEPPGWASSWSSRAPSSTS